MGQTFFASLAGAMWIGPLSALVQVVLIDLVLAGDNAVAVGISTSGLTPKDRRLAILLGLAAAVVMRIAFALAAAQLLNLIGLTLAGGILLLWVCLKMVGELRAQGRAARDQADPPAKTLSQAFLHILAADLSMSLDNVLAVAGAAHAHPYILVFGLLLSIGLTGLAANAIAKFLHRMRWLGYVGVAIVFYVALHMMWEGYRGVVIGLDAVAPYNALMPDWLDIKPGEEAAHHKKK
ncbi:YjbE family putative metal transport protein [Phenylobacterium montanum]|uniref:YjbE family putative metal transport protein n=1 Tax=Phenylobacterium montanum TaxID=2823693 RepID=A0A975FZU5_9CAUL|nr:YjbE family putative metal transport protein [Caulobacter sp. S6]QUD87952.1 YjbE family putative metal transport protein [Caulobacter sp. S6]